MLRNSAMPGSLTPRHKGTVYWRSISIYPSSQALLLLQLLTLPGGDAQGGQGAAAQKAKAKAA